MGRTCCALLLPFVFVVSSTAGGEPIRVGTNVWPGYEPLYLARELGLLDESIVKLVQFRSATQVMHALQTGSIEACALTLDEVVTVTCSGTPMTLVMAVDQSSGGDCIIAQPGIVDVAALAGKKVAVENTALGAFMLLRALEESGMALEDVRPVRLDVVRHPDAFHRGDVAASVCFEPTRSKLLASGGVEIFNSRQIPGEIVDVLAVRQEDEAEHTAALRHIGEAWDAALEYMEQEPNDAYAILGRRMGLSPTETREAYEGVKLLDRKASRELLSSELFTGTTLPKLLDFMLKQELVDTPVMPAIDPEPAGLPRSE